MIVFAFAWYFAIHYSVPLMFGAPTSYVVANLAYFGGALLVWYVLVWPVQKSYRDWVKSNKAR